MIRKGLKDGLTTTFELGKVVLPTAIILSFFRASGFLDTIIAFFTPYMGYFGLPGDAAIPLFSGYFVNLYAAIASLMMLEMPPRAMLIVAVMLGFCHSLLVELAVSKKAGSPISYIFPLRMGLSVLVGAILGGIL